MSSCACGHPLGKHTWAGCIQVVNPGSLDPYCSCSETFGVTRDGPVSNASELGITYGQIRLRRDGMHAVVSILHDGEEIDIIREVFDNNFDHVITPNGIREEITMYEERKDTK